MVRVRVVAQTEYPIAERRYVVRAIARVVLQHMMSAQSAARFDGAHMARSVIEACRPS